MNNVRLLLSAVLTVSGSVAWSYSLPNPGRFLDQTVPATPSGMVEFGRGARIIPMHYRKELVGNAFQDPAVLNSQACFCMISWRIKQSEFSMPGTLRINWGVFTSIPSAKLGALSMTWGQHARPPKSSLPKGTFTSKLLGEEAWCSSKGSPVTLVTRDGLAVVQVTYQPPSRLVGKSISFGPIRRKDLLLMEKLARETLTKSVHVQG